MGIDGFQGWSLRSGGRIESSRRRKCKAYLHNVHDLTLVDTIVL